MKMMISACVAAVSAAVCAAEPMAMSLGFFAPERREGQREYEASLNELISNARLREWHERLASEPHIAGTQGDLRLIETLRESFEGMGLETDVHWFWPLLTHPPKRASLEIVSPAREVLEFSEPAIERDPDTAHPALSIPFSGYSGMGDVTAEVVYANHGTKEDFEKLKSLGVDVTGKIVIARYGKNFRGYKVKFAEEAGAAGLIIYTDPAQSGYMRGLMYPEGGWATDRQVERGSLATMGYSGDPLTPGFESTEEAQRLSVDQVELPQIPVQPVGWSVAEKILEKMTGAAVPDESWQGALPFAYRVTGGEALRVRLVVEPTIGIFKTANVTATLRGSTHPDETIVIGCHHDAWGFGACDPLAGLHVMMESARAFASLAAEGKRPARTIIFAAWGAEEQGIIGSSEWVEKHRAELVANSVLYVNLDMSSMGPLFGSSAAPTLATLVIEATREVKQARDPERLVFDEWVLRSNATGEVSADALPRVGAMGGGSDHVGFYFHACVPSMSLGGGGSRGSSYHSNYDTIRWYQQVVGDDYEPSRMIGQVLNVVVSRAAGADVVPLDPRGIAMMTRRHLDALEARAKVMKVNVDLSGARSACDVLETEAAVFVEEALVMVERAAEKREAVEKLSRTLLMLERAWMFEEGLPGRGWMKSMYMSPDEDSGYASWPLPRARWGVERGNENAAQDGAADVAHRLGRITELLRSARMEAAAMSQ